MIASKFQFLRYLRSNEVAPRKVRSIEVKLDEFQFEMPFPVNEDAPLNTLDKLVTLDISQLDRFPLNAVASLNVKSKLVKLSMFQRSNPTPVNEVARLNVKSKLPTLDVSQLERFPLNEVAA